MIVTTRGIVGAVRQRTHSLRGYPLGECPLCHRKQEAGYCEWCGCSVDPLDKSIRWPSERSCLPTEEDVKEWGE